MPATAKRETHSTDLAIDQLPPITGEPLAARKPDIMIVDKDLKAALSPEYLAELAFNEEPVLIRLEEGSSETAPKIFPIWNNGTPCELLVNQNGFVDNLDDSGKWMQMQNGFVPVGVTVVMKRKYLATLASAKQTKVNTVYGEPGSPDAGRNEVTRGTSSAQVFSVLEDRNPKGRPWLREVMRRNF